MSRRDPGETKAVTLAPLRNGFCLCNLTGGDQRRRKYNDKNNKKDYSIYSLRNVYRRGRVFFCDRNERLSELGR